MNLVKQKGFSLIELMVAMTLGLILLAGVVAIFFSSKVTYMTNEKTGRLQENGRVALDIMSYDLRNSGYLGCAKVPQYFTSTLVNQTSMLWNYAAPVQGFESDNTGSYAPVLAAGTLNPAPTANSDVLVVRTLLRDGAAMDVGADVGSATGNPQVPVGAPPADGQILVITDCESSTVFQATGWAGASPLGSILHATGGAWVPGNTTTDLGYPYMQLSRVLPLQTYIYYVGNNAAGEPGLYRQAGAAQPAEMLIEGVQALQVAYAEDTTGDRIADGYFTANNVTTWGNVVSVTLAMLIRSEESGTQVNTTGYQLLPSTVGGRLITPAAGDRRQRMLFTTTVAIRNRAL